MLAPGDLAPPISLLDHDGAAVTLASYAGRQVLVFFYPKASTPGCTQQACALEAIRSDVGDVAILGISPDAPAKQKRFAVAQSLGFPLLADTEHVVAQAYDVWQEKSMYGKTYMGIVRSAFLVDEKGTVREAWYKVKPAATATNLLAALNKS